MLPSFLPSFVSSFLRSCLPSFLPPFPRSFLSFFLFVPFFAAFFSLLLSFSLFLPSFFLFLTFMVCLSFCVPRCFLSFFSLSRSLFLSLFVFTSSLTQGCILYYKWEQGIIVIEIYLTYITNGEYYKKFSLLLLRNLQYLFCHLPTPTLGRIFDNDSYTGDQHGSLRTLETAQYSTVQTVSVVLGCRSTRDVYTCICPNVSTCL